MWQCVVDMFQRLAHDIPVWAGQLLRFAFKMSPGDIVVHPNGFRQHPEPGSDRLRWSLCGRTYELKRLDEDYSTPTWRRRRRAEPGIVDPLLNRSRASEPTGGGARGFQDAPGTHQLSKMAPGEHLEAPRIGLFLPSTPLSYDLLRPPNVLWEQGVVSSNLTVPIACFPLG
jgi:hypothetical protein